jgi:hypothetical protein
MNIKKIFIIYGFYILIFMVPLPYLNANYMNDSLFIDKNRSHFFINIGTAFTEQPLKFFSSYKIIGDSTKTFSNNPMISIGYKTQFINNWRFAVAIEYTSCSFTDIHYETFSIGNNHYTRNSNEDFNISTLPVILSIEAVPIVSQFRTYFGFGLGLTLSRTIWNEDVNSTFKYDSRHSGTKYNNIDISPTIEIYLGIDLRFDRDEPDYFIESLNPELKFLFIYRRIDIFKNIKSEFVSIPKDWNNSYSFFPFYICFNLGLMFNTNKH